MTEGDDPWTPFQISLLMVATNLAIVCVVCLMLNALRPYITTNESQMPVTDLALPRIPAGN